VIHPLDPADASTAWRTLTAAFDEDPMFRFLLPDAERRRAWLPLIMAMALHQSRPAGQVCTPAGGAASGILAMIPPGAYPPPLRLASFLARPGRRPPLAAPTRQLMRVGRDVVRLMEQAHPRQPHLYVLVVGVDPARKGLGLGRQLLQHAVESAERAGVPAYLETSNRVNLGFYARFGFEVEQELHARDGAPPVWTLLRPLGARV
jgi:GNAT superfamily N-acetyltransferase